MFRCGTVTQSVRMTRYTAFGSSRHITNHLKSSDPLSAGNLCHGRRLPSKISFHSRRTSIYFTETACLIQSNIVYLLLILSNFHYMNLLSYFDDMNRLRSDPSDTKNFCLIHSAGGYPRLLQGNRRCATVMVLEGPDAAVVCPFEWSSLALGHSRRLLSRAEEWCRVAVPRAGPPPRVYQNASQVNLLEHCYISC